VKIGRSQREPSESRIIAFPGIANAGAPATAFVAALRQHQQRPATHREEPGRASDSSSARRAGNRVSASHQPNSDADELGCVVASEEVSELPPDSACLLSELFIRTAPSVEQWVGAAARRDARRRRCGDSDDESPCIEITHSPTGTRCLLSRQDGIWILSLQPQSAVSPANRRALLEALRSQFTERGLGPIDIVL
jgi:hypothetical protein